MKNIYNQPLKPCGNKNMGNGSWDNRSNVPELGGGVHQICIKYLYKLKHLFGLR